MSGVERALRDTNSPVTPVTPFAINKPFDCELQNDEATLRSWLDRYRSPYTRRRRQSPCNRSPRRLTPRARSPKFLEVPKSGQRAGRNANLAARRHCRQLRLQLLKRHYLSPHEVPTLPKPLSPRVSELLRRVGMIKYGSLFQREEIDFEVFCTLSQRDLEQLGIADGEDRRDIRKAVILAHDLT